MVTTLIIKLEPVLYVLCCTLVFPGKTWHSDSPGCESWHCLSLWWKSRFEWGFLLTSSDCWKMLETVHKLRLQKSILHTFMLHMCMLPFANLHTAHVQTFPCILDMLNEHCSCCKMIASCSLHIFNVDPYKETILKMRILKLRILTMWIPIRRRSKKCRS